MANFELGQKVECKSGRGKITYLEDGLMEVTLTTGVEKNFWAPFDGKVWPYQEPEKQLPVSEHPVWSRIASNQAIANHMNGAKAYHTLIGGLLTRIGGGASSWDRMSAYQQVNVLAVYLGIPVGVLKEAEETNSLTKLLASPSIEANGYARPYVGPSKSTSLL